MAAWKKSISNMYWFAASTQDGNAQLMVEKWKTIPLHIQNIHQNDTNEVYIECGHGELDEEARDRLWLAPGTRKCQTPSLLLEIMFSEIICQSWLCNHIPIHTLPSLHKVVQQQLHWRSYWRVNTCSMMLHSFLRSTKLQHSRQSTAWTSSLFRRALLSPTGGCMYGMTEYDISG